MITADVAGAEMDALQVHDSYMALENVEWDFRAMKTVALEGRPIFVQKASGTRGPVFCRMLALKLVRKMEQRRRIAFPTTAEDPYTLPLPYALAALGHLGRVGRTHPGQDRQI